MSLLHVALQEGFEGETVAVRLNDKEVFRQDNVTTRLQIGLAHSFEVQAADAPAQVKIDVPSRGVSEVIEADLSAPKYLGISLAGGAVSSRLQNDPFRYA